MVSICKYTVCNEKKLYITVNIPAEPIRMLDATITCKVDPFHTSTQQTYVIVWQGQLCNVRYYSNII